MFKTIKNETDISELMIFYDNFHDSLIKEIHYTSGGYVQDDRVMYPVNSERALSILFESQHAECKILELQFDKIKEFHLIPNGPDFDCVIYGATFKKDGKLFFWADCPDLSVDKIPKDYGTWVISESVSWRGVR